MISRKLSFLYFNGGEELIKENHEVDGLNDFSGLDEVRNCCKPFLKPDDNGVDANPEDLVVIHNGNVLEGNKPLIHYNIDEISTICILVKYPQEDKYCG